MSKEQLLYVADGRKQKFEITLMEDYWMAEALKLLVNYEAADSDCIQQYLDSRCYAREPPDDYLTTWRVMIRS